MLREHCHQSVAITQAGDLLVARGIALDLGSGGTLNEVQRERFALIITELANNLLRYAPAGGALLLRRWNGRGGLECICYDRGPGIADLDRELRDGQSSGSSLGIGLGAVRRLADEFAIHSEPALGTAVLARVGQAVSSTADRLVFGAVMVPMAGQEHCGDGWVVRDDGPGFGTLVAVIDGLGHGPEAAFAARRAEQSVESGGTDPKQVIRLMDEALRGTRGAVAMVLYITVDTIAFCGIGNIAGVLIGSGLVAPLPSAWGVVGNRVTGCATQSLTWQSGDVLVLTSDGVARATETFAKCHLRYCHPTLAAAIILRDGSHKLDDQTVLVLRR